MKRRRYQEAIKQAWDLLKAIGKKGRVESEFLGNSYAVDFERKTIVNLTEDIPVKEYYAVLILHYLAKERAVSISEQINWVSFQDLESGKFYYSAFSRRSIDRLNRQFSQNPQRLWENARGLKCQKLKVGDFGFQIQAFPKIFVAIIYWRGDEEVSSGYDLLFNRETGQIYSTEDVVVLAQTVVGVITRPFKIFPCPDSSGRRKNFRGRASARQPV